MHHLKSKIIYEKTLKNIGLFNQSTIIDGHIHSNYSVDSITAPIKIIKKAKSIGLNGVAIADHNEIGGNLEAANNNLGIMVIPAIEITAGKNLKGEQVGAHILCYFNSHKLLKKFYDNIIKPNKTYGAFGRTKLAIEQIIQYAKEYDGMVIAPHPFVMAFNGIGHWLTSDITANIDAIEVINSCVAKNANIKAIKFSKLNNKPITGGSDAHTIREIGGAVTITKKTDCAADFVQEIKDGRSIVLGKSQPPLITLSSFLWKEFLNIQNSFSQKYLFKHLYYGYLINAHHYYFNKIKRRDKFILPKI